MYSVYSKAQAGFVLKKVHTNKDYEYRTKIMRGVLERVVAEKPLSLDMTEYIPKGLPQNIAPV